MSSLNNILSHIMGKISTVSEQLREIEDICSKFSIDPTSSPDYIAVVAYKAALTDLLDEIRRLDGDSKHSSNIRRGGGG